MDPSVVHARVMQLGRATFAPFEAMSRRMLAGFGVSTGAALGVGLATGQPLLGGAVGLAVSLVGAVIAWAPFGDPTFRAAIELILDHHCHETAEWKKETGTSMPRNLDAAERWLVGHPTGPGRASMLLFTGRLDEADRAIDAIEPKTPEEAFGVEILRGQRVLCAGGAPDTTSLHASWGSLPDPRERRHRRECLALLDAQATVDHGGDAFTVLAAARTEVGRISCSMRAPLLMTKWYTFALLAIATTTLVSAALT